MRSTRLRRCQDRQRSCARVVGRSGYRPGMRYFHCTLVHGPAWDSTRGIREQDGWAAHAAFMDGLVADGFLVVGGPVGAGDVTAHLIHAADVDHVRARLAEDPWAADGHLEIGSLEPWALWLDGLALGSSAATG